MVPARFFSILTAALILVVMFQSGRMAAAAPAAVWRIQIVADDMCCRGCAQKVAAQLYAAPGVTSVEADVPKRTVVVTAKPSAKLTLHRLWQAVEQGKGGPSKLVGPQGIYSLKPLESLKPEDRLPSGQYALVVRELKDKQSAQAIANALYAIRGVSNVSVDVEKRTLLVQTSDIPALSPWALAAAAEQAKAEPVTISGPHGLFTIEELATANRATADRLGYPQVPRGVR
jgi:copper chaperone CopZ